MPTNQTKTYNQVLELLHNSFPQNLNSIQKVFQRDFCVGVPCICKQIPVIPTPAEGEDAMDRLFRHLTTTITDESTRKREFESERAIRIHWVRYHIENKNILPLLVFQVIDEKRIYILDKQERYVIVLEPKQHMKFLYLLTAYKLEPANYKKILKKFEKRGNLL